jgi:hypothetical protein
MNRSATALLVFCGTTPLWAYPTDENSPAPIVRATVLRRYYCLGQPGAFFVGPWAEPESAGVITLRLVLHLSYSNVASRPLILPTPYRVAALIVRPSSGRLSSLVIPFQPWVSAGDLTQGGIDKPNRNFEIIPPGDTAARFGNVEQCSERRYLCRWSLITCVSRRRLPRTWREDGGATDISGSAR